MKPIGPYTSVRQAGNLYFVAGQIGIDPKTKQAKESIEDQTHQTLKNLETVLETINLSLGNVVKVTIFLQDMEDYSVVNEVYGSYISAIPPARSCVEVSGLPKIGDNKILIEIEAVAYKAK